MTTRRSRMFYAATLLVVLTVHFITPSAQAQFGNALSLSGVNQHVTVPAAAASAVNTPLTVEAWVYVRSYEEWSRLMDFGNGPGFDNIACVLSSGSSGQPAFYFFDGSGAIVGSVDSPTVLPLNTWTHLAFTADGTTGSILINGNLVVSGPMPALLSATRTNNFIGRSNFDNNGYANAIIDEFRIWSVARSQSQIQASIGAPLVGNESGLFLYYKFDNATGTVATNSATATGAAFNGTLINSPEWAHGLPTLVLNTDDDGPGSLRNAISTTPPGGLIAFAPNLSGQTITLTSGQLVLWKNITIDASTLADGLTVSGVDSRIFLITSNATAVLNSFRIANGLPGSNAPPPNFQPNILGGGIYNSSNCTLTVTRCVLSGNQAGTSVRSAFLAGGGGIYNEGTLTLDQCTLSGNSAYATATAGNGCGGAIYNTGIATLNSCTLSSNYAKGNDRGSSGSIFARGTGDGAGIYNTGTLTLGNCFLSGNSCIGGTGIGGGSPSAAAGGSARGGGIYNTGTLALDQSTFSSNVNTAGSGFTSGTGTGAGGGEARGGGVYNLGYVSVVRCTFASNSNAGGAGGNTSINSYGANGGAANGGGIFNGGDLSLHQTTLSANSNLGGVHGTGPLGKNGADGDSSGGGIYTTPTNAILHSSLIALNQGGNGPDLSGPFVSQGYNLVGATNNSTGIVGGITGDLTGSMAAPLNPLLGPLANYGGPTLTMALLSGSPAIDAGDDSVALSYGTDQRGPGFARLVLQHVDIGSYEFGNGVLAPTIALLNTGSVTIHPATHLGSLTVGASVNPNSIDASANVWVQYGSSIAYNLATPHLTVSPGTNYVPLSLPLTSLAPGVTWHYRWVAANEMGTNFSADQTFTVSPLFAAGDLNGDGIVNLSELNTVYANYVTNSPWLSMTNVAGLGGTNVTFSLSDSVLGAYSIEYSTNLVDWDYLGAATPRYLFTDTNAPTAPHRHYRLRYP